VMCKLASYDNIIEEVYVDGNWTEIHRDVDAGSYAAHRTSYITFSAESSTLAFGRVWRTCFNNIRVAFNSIDEGW